MKDEDRARCERLAYASKKTTPLSDEELGFMHKMWVNHPVEYKAIQRAVRDQVTGELNPLFSGSGDLPR